MKTTTIGKLWVILILDKLDFKTNKQKNKEHFII